MTAHKIQPSPNYNDHTIYILSYREKKVCGIACGGLHNAVWTQTVRREEKTQLASKQSMIGRKKHILVKSKNRETSLPFCRRTFDS